MADRYFDHIVGCLEASIKAAEDGVDCRISAVTVQGAVDLLKEQQEKIEHPTAIWFDELVMPPKIGKKVLCLWADGRIAEGFYSVDDGWYGHPIGLAPTHWMELPKLPKKGGDMDEK